MENKIPTNMYLIVGEDMSGIGFIRDYIEFYFEEKILRSLTKPQVNIGGQIVAFPSVGSRDVLCSLIGKRVEKLVIDEEQKIEIVFSDLSILVIPLDPISRNGDEAAHFVIGDARSMEVW